MRTKTKILSVVTTLALVFSMFTPNLSFASDDEFKSNIIKQSGFALLERVILDPDVEVAKSNRGSNDNTIILNYNNGDLISEISIVNEDSTSITYKIVEGDLEDLLEINKKTGEIYLDGALVEFKEYSSDTKHSDESLATYSWWGPEIDIRHFDARLQQSIQIITVSSLAYIISTMSPAFVGGAIALAIHIKDVAGIWAEPMHIYGLRATQLENPDFYRYRYVFKYYDSSSRTGTPKAIDYQIRQ